MSNEKFKPQEEVWYQLTKDHSIPAIFKGYDKKYPNEYCVISYGILKETVTVQSVHVKDIKKRYPQ